MFRFGDPGGRAYGTVGANQANIAAYWPGYAANGTSFPNTNLTMSPSGGRLGGPTLLFTAVSGATNWWSFMRTFDSQQTWGAAYAIKPSHLPQGYNAFGVIISNNGQMQCFLQFNQDGSLSFYHGGNVFGTTIPNLIVPGTWNHVEFKVKIASTATGTVYIGVNGIQRLSLTNIATTPYVNNTANQVQVGMGYVNSGACLPAGGTMYIDDIIIYDGQVSDANGYPDITGPIGDCSLSWLPVVGVGNTTQFTPNSAGLNYTKVNEASPDGDTSYVESATIGNIDTYAIENLPGSAANIKSVGVIHNARKTDFTQRNMKSVIWSAGSNKVHGSEIILSDTYLYSMQNYGRDPNNGSTAVWTPAAVNAMEIGQQVSS